MFVRTAIAAALVAFATPALAGTILYGSDEKNLYTINTATGAATLIGATGLTGFDDTNTGSILRDLTSSGSTLYGAQWNASANGIRGAITTLNTATGAITSTVNITGLVETGLNRFNQGVYAIAFDRATNTLFGTTQQRLYTIDTTSGVASLVGALSNIGQIGLGFDAGTNALYSVTQSLDANDNPVTFLNMLDRTTAATLSSTVLSISCGCDIAFDPLGNQGYISSLTTDGVSTFGALDRLNAGLTGTTTIGLHGGANMSGLAFLGQTTAVPEPATWAMMIFGFGLIGGAVRRSARRQSAGKRSLQNMG